MPAVLGESCRAWELLALINPINHAKSPEEIAIHKGEPYVAAADVYAAPPYIGRGGMGLVYTGSAGLDVQTYRGITYGAAA